jgi:hypothetical protein
MYEGEYMMVHVFKVLGTSIILKMLHTMVVGLREPYTNFS